MLPGPGFSDLADREVGIWGFGVEGRATLRALTYAGVTPRIIADDSPREGESVATPTALSELLRCAVVIKSPGISRYRPEVARLESEGVLVTSALALWMAHHDLSRLIAVTGTKGKSTTTSLIAFLLHAVGEEASLAGNIGTAPYDPDFVDDGRWIVLEVSSFQATDLRRCPRYVALTALGSDHLDWHGDLETYRRDKLSFLDWSDPHLSVLSADPTLASLAVSGDVIRLDEPGAALHELARLLGLVGEHNVRNLDLAVEVVSRATGLSRSTLLDLASEHQGEFSPLPGRLSVVHRAQGHVYVDDGLATSALPTVAALDVFEGPVALICGGFDRGVDYQPLADALAQRPLIHLITTGPAGRRLGVLARSLGVSVLDATDLAEAVHLAREVIAQGTILFSPAAPSFDAYDNWAERSADFTRLARATTPRS
jgi:UDP-N-acetylmuramoylalanine--D-glutamate ligase